MATFSDPDLPGGGEMPILQGVTLAVQEYNETRLITGHLSRVETVVKPTALACLTAILSGKEVTKK